MPHEQHLRAVDVELHTLLMHAYAALGSATSSEQVEAVLAQIEVCRCECDELYKSGIVRAEIERQREERRAAAVTLPLPEAWIPHVVSGGKR